MVYQTACRVSVNTLEVHQATKNKGENVSLNRTNSTKNTQKSRKSNNNGKLRQKFDNNQQKINIMCRKTQPKSAKTEKIR